MHSIWEWLSISKICGEWGMGNGDWGMGNERLSRGMGIEVWEMGNGDWEWDLGNGGMWVAEYDLENGE